MTYIIGYNANSRKGEQWKKINLNSTTDIYVSNILANALEEKHTGLYEKITEQSGGHFIRFDELNKHDFMKVVKEINQFLKRENLTDFQKKGIELWLTFIDPLIKIDERYDIRLT